MNIPDSIKIKSPNTDKKTDMGMPPELTGHQVVFCRKFRFAFRATHLNESYVKSVEIDHFNKKIHLSIYQIMLPSGLPSLGFLNTLSDAELDIYDGCGTVLYNIKFIGLSLEAHSVKLDYSDSDVLTDDICLSYEKELKTFPALKQFSPVSHLKDLVASPDNVWKIEIAGNEYLLDTMKRPTLKIEEVLLQHKNANFWIPGRAYWEAANLKILTSDYLDLENTKEFVIRLYVSDIIREEWVCQQAITRKVDRRTEGEIEWQIRLANVFYKNVG